VVESKDSTSAPAVSISDKAAFAPPPESKEGTTIETTAADASNDRLLLASVEHAA
jgi:hypothetical protein